MDPGPPRRRAVLALLLINAGKVVSTSSMVHSLWEGEPPHRAVATLQSYVSRLRRMISDQAPRHQVELQLRYRAPGYVLNVAPDQVDVMRFESAVVRGLEAQRRGDFTQTFALTSEALRLWTAPPFEDLAEYEFAAQEENRLDQLRLAAVEARAEVAYALGRSEEVLHALEREVADHPTRERLVHQLMRAHYRNGRQADALRLFERTRRYLADELGVDVSPGLQRLHEEILRHDPVLAHLPGPSEPPLTVTTRTQFGHRPHAEFDTEPYLGQRTGSPTAFVGRQGELRQLLAAADASEHGEGRTVLVVGEAGLGKTTLVRELGRRAREAGTDVVNVNCPMSEDMPPYWLWVQVLRQVAARRPETLRCLPDRARRALAAVVPELFPDLAGGDRPELSGEARFALHDAVSQVLLGSNRHPLVLILEDVHWADDASLRLLPFLTRQSVDSRFLLVVTSRSFRMADDPGLRAFRAAVLQSINAEEIRLAALSSDESRQIALSVSAGATDPVLCAALHERSGGNPFLLLGLLDSLGEGATAQQVQGLVPQMIREVVNERLSGLPDEVRALLDCCAAGAPVDNHLGAPCDGPVAVSRETFRRAVRGGLLVPDDTAPEGMGFVHPLIRDVVRQELTYLAPQPRTTAPATARTTEHECGEAMRHRTHIAAAARVAVRGGSPAKPVSPGTPWPSRPR
ncbi:BTAD domain-containing putative transcriptional regulator [Streptomyces sp. NPDC056361]|uniref:BTAD domain-containing putative transcriptional regulator n=1 Tax=Streptomyces sp. NPDC056361 TaxID=3345795 RepID=UPI0035E015B9